jgi:hypothetical protein
MPLIRAQLAGLILAMAAVSPALPIDMRPDRVQLAAACPNTGELVIDKIKICYFTCPDLRTSIRIGADDICPPFHCPACSRPP